MVEISHDGVERATKTVNDLRGDSQSFLDEVSEQMRERIAHQTSVREGLAAQVARLDVLIAHQQAQLDQLTASRAAFPSADAMRLEDVETLPDLADPEVSLSDRVHTALVLYGSMDRDGLVELLIENGDAEADNRRVAAAITNLVKSERALKDDDGWVSAL